MATGDAGRNWLGWVGGALSTVFTNSLNTYFTAHLLCTRSGESMVNETGNNVYTQESHHLIEREIQQSNSK